MHRSSPPFFRRRTQRKVHDHGSWECIRRLRRRQPGQIAIVEGDRRVSYSDWYCEIKAVGGALRDMGLKPATISSR
jgi:non-ribosomal peptide synthetase component E (peptide arylation enzyme)